MDYTNKRWGPVFWDSIHTLAANYNPNDPLSSRAFLDFLNSLTVLLPCDVCRQNLSRHLTEDLPVNQYLATKDSLFLWTYFIHDIVNGELDKISPPYNVVYRYYVNKYRVIGPQIWVMLHTIAANYDPSNPKSKDAFSNFIWSLVTLLPFSYGQRLNIHLNTDLSFESYLKSRDQIFLWSYLLHNKINQELGKVSLPYEHVYRYYIPNGKCSNCNVGS